MSFDSSIDPRLAQSHDIDPELLDSHPDQEDFARFTPEEEAVSRPDFHKPLSSYLTGNVRPLKLLLFRQGSSFSVSRSESRRQRPVPNIAVLPSYWGI